MYCDEEYNFDFPKILVPTISGVDTVTNRCYDILMDYVARKESDVVLFSYATRKLILPTLTGFHYFFF